MQSYHWFTECIEELAEDSRVTRSEKLLVGLSSVIETFAAEANLSLEDQTRLKHLRRRAIGATEQRCFEKVDRIRTPVS